MDWLAQIPDLSHLIDGLFVPCGFVISLLFHIIAMWWRVNEGFPFADDRRGAIGIAFPPSPSLSLWLCFYARDLDPTATKGWTPPFLFHCFSSAQMTARILCVSTPLLFVQVLIVWQYRTHVLSLGVLRHQLERRRGSIDSFFSPFPSLLSKLGIELQRATDYSLELTRFRAIDFTLAHFVRYFLSGAQQAQRI